MSKPSITVVTGGSSGIGAACVRHLAKRGDQKPGIVLAPPDGERCGGN